MSAAGYFKITRPGNAAAAGAAAALAFWITGGTEWISALLLFCAVTSICGAGNAVNDCFDADIDRINHPKRPIPSGKATVAGGLILTGVLFAAGFLCSLPLGPWCPWLAVVNILLLILYSTSFKRMPVIGNVCVAYLSGSVFLFGGMAVGAESFLLTAPLFLVTFFATLAREIVKDAENIKEDETEGAYTFPMLAGINTAGITAFVCMICAAGTAFIPVLYWGLPYACFISAVDVFLITSAAKILSCKTPEEVQAAKISRTMKTGMIAATLVFFVSAVLSRFLI